MLSFFMYPLNLFFVYHFFFMLYTYVFTLFMYYLFCTHKVIVKRDKSIIPKILIFVLHDIYIFFHLFRTFCSTKYKKNTRVRGMMAHCVLLRGSNTGFWSRKKPESQLHQWVFFIFLWIFRIPADVFLINCRSNWIAHHKPQSRTCTEDK